MDLESCLPRDLRRHDTTITRIAAGLSGAGVYRVEAEGQPFVLKVAAEDEPAGAFANKLHIQRLAAEAGLSPRIVHADHERRAIVSAFVADRSFAAFYMDPRTRDAALTLLGRTVRRVHDLPLPPNADGKDPREVLGAIWTGLTAAFAVPRFVRDAVERVLAEQAPARERAPVLSHNDVNPSNLVYDGERLLLLDWDTAGSNDPFHDLATAAVFLRMDEDTCRKLLGAYDGEAPAALPARFVYSRRVVAVLVGSIFLQLARQSGHAGATGEETLESSLALAEFYQRMRAGSLSVATAEGRWTFALALMKESAGL